MALYEVVLRFPDRDEVRVTDQPLREGQTIEIEGHVWRVIRTEANGNTQFICSPLRQA